VGGHGEGGGETVKGGSENIEKEKRGLEEIVG